MDLAGVLRPRQGLDGTPYVSGYVYENRESYGVVYALEPTSKQPLPGKSIRLAVRGSSLQNLVIVADGTIYMQGGTMLVAVRNGAILWSYQYDGYGQLVRSFITELSLTSTPVMAPDGTVDIATSNDDLIAIPTNLAGNHILSSNAGPVERLPFPTPPHIGTNA